LAALVLAGHASGAEAPLPPKTQFKIFLLIGQSNMAGRGRVEEQDKQSHPRVLSLNKEDRWIPAVDPIHFDKPDRTGVGLGTTFGRVVAEALPQDTIGLVPCAVGGTSIDRWAKGGTLYAESLRRARLALQHGELAGILWHQGETGSDPATYAEKAKRLFEDLRADLATPRAPVVVGTLGDFYGASKELNPVLLALPDKIPCSVCADAAGLKDKGDRTHFDAASYRELGRRYAAAWLKLTGKTPPAGR
jgi:hypothetical protein